MDFWTSGAWVDALKVALCMLVYYVCGSWLWAWSERYGQQRVAVRQAAILRDAGARQPASLRAEPNLPQMQLLRAHNSRVARRVSVKER